LDEQGDTNNKGIQAVEPLQKHLEIHLPPWKQAAVAERPIRTGQSCFHDTGCPSNHHKGDQSDDQVSGELRQAQTNRNYYR
jgi:hypothetical protein